MTGVSVDERDTGADAIMRAFRKLEQDITFGVHADAEPYDDGTSVAVVGAVHEFSERSFLRGWVDSGGKNALADATGPELVKVLQGGAPEKLGEKLGEVAVKGVIDRMKRGISPGLDDGSGRTPLIKTEHLIDNITAKVVVR